jgi:type I restriction enzyme S subunit
MGEFPLWLPSLEEQRRIADFLDAETARIDTFIELRSRWASLLLQRFDESVRQSTRESGDERFIPLRRILARIKTGATPRADQTDLFVEKGVPWYTPGSFLSGVSLGSAERSIDPSAVKRSVPRFPADSVVIVGIGATAGRVAYLDRDGTGNQQLTALTFQPEVHARFLAWQLYAVTDELRQLAPFTTLPIINNDFLKAFPVWSPAPERQRAIAADIDRDWVLLQDLLDAQERQRALLAERRQALITASVTGQFDVTTAKGVDLP